MCVCVCVCVREREREIMCVCVHASVYVCVHEKIWGNIFYVSVCVYFFPFILHKEIKKKSKRKKQANI